MSFFVKWMKITFKISSTLLALANKFLITGIFNDIYLFLALCFNADQILNAITAGL